VEGDYTEDTTFVVIAIGHPPCESRETARSIYGHIDFLGKGATTLLEDVCDFLSHRTGQPFSNFF
jgi:DNA polymerase epsilon subunit 2